MIDNSAKYGLYNPAFTEDIGESQLFKNRVDNVEDYGISGNTFGLENVNINGNLNQDKFETSSKKKKIIGWSLAGLATAAFAVFCLKFKGISKLRTLGSTAIDKIKDLGSKIKNLIHK